MAPRQSSALEKIARIGYAARGAVFVLVGGLSIMAAIGARAAAPGPSDIFGNLVGQPFGRAALILLGFGLFCFAAWRLVQALLDADHCGNDLGGWLRRAVYLGSAVFYAGLGLVPLSILINAGRGSRGDQPAHDWTAWLLGMPAGRWLLAAIGLGTVMGGIAIAVAGVRGRFADRLKLKEEPRRIITSLARFGFVARALVFVLIGAFLFFAAVHHDPSEARGLTGTFRLIQSQPYGSILLAITAAGFLAFGCYELVEAVSRRISAPSVKQTAKALKRHSRAHIKAR